MYKAYKFRMYPSPDQKILISKTFRCTRFIYNYFLDRCKNYKYKKAYDMCNELKELQKEYVWLKEVDSCSLRCAIFNLEDAYKNFFSKRSGYPVFKSRYSTQSYRTNCIRSSYKGRNYSNIEIKLKDKKIKLPKLGEVDIRGYRNLEDITGNIINATIIKESTGKYYVSVIVDEKEIKEESAVPKTIVGIDLGLKDLIVTSDGEKYENEKVLSRYEKRIKRLQRKLSRQVVKSNNYQKTRQKIAIMYSKIRNSRRHNIIDIVNKIVNNNDIIVSETLKVKEMVQNKRIGKLVLDAGFQKICSLLEWKSRVSGKYYYKIDSYYPSSQICSRCKERNNKIKDLKIREWECERCGSKHERDINASINIMLEGLKMHYEIV